MFFIDSHCHLHMLNYKNLHKDLNDVLKKAQKNRVNYILSVSTSLKDCKYFSKNKNVFYTCGVHPLNIEQYKFSQLINLAKNNLVIALGETGLDFFKNKNKEEIALQKKSFRNHIRAGTLLKKPIIIHSRNAYRDIIKILIEEKIENCSGVIHCFTENYSVAKKFLDMGLYISFSGIITFKKSYEIIKSLKFIPLDRILIETDSPYLSPYPYRGKENQPAFLKYIAKFISKIKNIDMDSLSFITNKNFSELFKITLK